MVKLNSKAQVKIQQTAFMLVALVILFVMIFLFIIQFKLASLRGSAQDLEEQNSVLMVSRLAESAEFSCGQAYGSQKEYCLDMDKIFVLSQNIEHYKSFFGVSNIEIRKIYPPELEKCTSTNYPNCGYIKILDKPSTGADHFAFVSLCRKEIVNGKYSNKCELGKLIVRYDLK